MEKLAQIGDLVSLIAETNDYFQQQAQKQVNVALTLRNWLIGFYIFEYEQHGEDRAVYGENLLKAIAQHCKGIKGLSERNLYLFRDFYRAYPQIQQSLTVELRDSIGNSILQSLTAKSELPNSIQKSIVQSVPEQFIEDDKMDAKLSTDPNLLINRLSFTHIIELIKAETPLKRYFYETEAIVNNWSVRQLKRSMDSMLFERTGLSTDKKQLLEKQEKGEILRPEEIFRNPYILEFLGLQEKAEYRESDLEQAIINHLQSFLLEMGRGFCFEARQKRITFDNTHYHIDMVFYHRILKCHVLIDLKLGAFDHADAGQMNVYLNYYSENETSEGDNPPVGIILCANKNENLVKYATTGLSQQVFVSKYLINLPSEEELKQILTDEQNRIQA